jgi:hypothetical protein
VWGDLLIGGWGNGRGYPGKIWAALRFRTRSFRLRVLQNTIGTVSGLSRAAGLPRSFYLAEMWNDKWNAGGLGRPWWPFSVVRNSNGHISGLSSLIATVNPDHLADTVATGPFSVVQNTNGPIWGLTRAIAAFRSVHLAEINGPVKSSS